MDNGPAQKKQRAEPQPGSTSEMAASPVLAMPPPGPLLPPESGLAGGNLVHENPVHENSECENLEHKNLACEPMGEQVAAATMTAANHTPANEALKGLIEEYFKWNKILPSTSSFKPIPPSVDSESTPLTVTRQQLDSAKSGTRSGLCFLKGEPRMTERG